MSTWNSDGSALNFQLDPRVQKIHLDGQTYDNGSITEPLSVPLTVVTFDDDAHEYPLGSAAVWEKGTTLILTGPHNLSGQEVVYVIPEREPEYNPPDSSEEHWTPADGKGIDPGTGADAEKMLFKNWRCGPKELPHNMHMFDVLLKGYKRFGGMKPAEFVDHYYPRDGSGPNTDQVTWPDAKDGHPNGFSSVQDIKKDRLPVNTLIDRFGYEDTGFFGAIGVTFAQRTLPPANLDFLGRYTEADFREQSTIDNPKQDMYRVYCITKEFNSEIGHIAPWFGQPGGGIQVYVDKQMNPEIPVEEGEKMNPKALVKAGYLRRLSWDEMERLFKNVSDRIDSDLAARDIHSAVTASALAVLAEAGYSMPHYHGPTAAT